MLVCLRKACLPGNLGFHVSVYSNVSTAASIVSQRIPDDHIAIVANMFTVRAVNLSDSFNFLGSPNMLTIAEKHGRWDPSQGLLDFTATFSFGEYAHKYYSGRRMWGGYRLMTDVELPDSYDNLTTDHVYNTTIPVRAPLYFLQSYALSGVGLILVVVFLFYDRRLAC